MEGLRTLQVYEIGPSFGRRCVDGLGNSVMELSKKLVEKGSIESIDAASIVS